MGNGHMYMQAEKDAYDEGVADGMRKVYDEVIEELENNRNISKIISNLKCERDSLD